MPDCRKSHVIFQNFLGEAPQTSAFARAFGARFGALPPYLAPFPKVLDSPLYTTSRSKRSPSQLTLHTQLLRLRHAASHVFSSAALAPLIAHTIHCQSYTRAGHVADGLSMAWPQLLVFGTSKIC